MGDKQSKTKNDMKSEITEAKAPLMTPKSITVASKSVVTESITVPPKVKEIQKPLYIVNIKYKDDENDESEEGNKKKLIEITETMISTIKSIDISSCVSYDIVKKKLSTRISLEFITNGYYPRINGSGGKFTCVTHDLEVYYYLISKCTNPINDTSGIKKQPSNKFDYTLMTDVDPQGFHTIRSNIKTDFEMRFCNDNIIKITRKYTIDPAQIKSIEVNSKILKISCIHCEDSQKIIYKGPPADEWQITGYEEFLSKINE
jgi:hypothetical protein